jgi:peptide deformylase
MRESILLLGDPGLREPSHPIADFDDPAVRAEGRRLARALEQFRAEHGFGRAISAPQIGIHRRMIAMNLGDGPFLLLNPELTARSESRFTMWDDCMSFPWLMVRLERHVTIDLAYQDEAGRNQRWSTVDQPVAELLQHEIDHLDGILAVDRALDRDAIVARALYLARREYFDRQVDYAIVPTLAGQPE